MRLFELFCYKDIVDFQAAEDDVVCQILHIAEIGEDGLG